MTALGPEGELDTIFKDGAPFILLNMLILLLLLSFNVTVHCVFLTLTSVCRNIRMLINESTLSLTSAVQQTLLEPRNAEIPTEENAV